MDVAVDDTSVYWTSAAGGLVGKIALVLRPWINHSWHVALRVTATGLTTGLLRHEALCFEIAFAQRARHLDDLGDRGVAGDRDRDFLGTRAGALTARRIASPTASASTMAFSFMAFCGVGSAAYDSTR